MKPEARNNITHFFEILNAFPDEMLESVIKNDIIPKMNIRRNKLSNMQQNEIMEKLYRPEHTGKKGEVRETNEVLFADINNTKGITKEIAGELADQGYYRLQPNVPEKENLVNWYYSEAIGFRGIPYESILIFTIIKYVYRMSSGDDKNYKDAEHEALQKYLDTQPELTNLWLTT